MPSNESKLNKIPDRELRIISGMFKDTSKQLKTKEGDTWHEEGIQLREN